MALAMTALMLQMLRKAAIMMKCYEKAKDAKCIEPDVTKQLESGLVQLITPAMFEVNQVAIMKEGDRVQVGNKEVLVWHMEGVRKKEKISEDTQSRKDILRKCI